MVLINLNGEISTTASISVLDRSFLYGDSIYEVVRTFNGKTFALQEHLDRLRQSAAYCYLDVPWSDAHIRAETEKTLQQAAFRAAYVRIVVTRGAEPEISLQPGPDIQPSLLIIVREISPEPVLAEQGARLSVLERLRNDQQALNPAAKTGNYLNNILAQIEATQKGVDDALMLNSRGELTEATTSNLWLVQDGVVRTPAVETGILHGITRHFLLQILQEQQIPHEETILKPADLSLAEEGFLSSSVRLIMPIAQIDDYKLPQCPGKLTYLLWQSLLQLMDQHTRQ